MAHPEQPDAATDESGAADSPAGGESPEKDALAGAEEAAAREAQVEASRAESAASAKSPANAAGGPKVVRPKAKTSQKTPMASKSAASVTVIPPAPAGDDRLTRLDFVSIREAGAQEVNATNVDVSRGGIGRAQAVDIAVSQGGIGFARGDRVSVEMGGIGAALGGEVRVTQGGVGSVLARDVHIEQAVVRTVIANNVRFERTTGVLILLARRVEGDVRVLLDWRGAVAFGAALGVVVSLFRRRK